MIEYDVALAYNKDGIQSELRLRAEDWRLVYGYQSATSFFGFSDGGHVLVFMRTKAARDIEFESTIGGY